MKQGLTDRGDGEELIDTELGCVHSTDSQLQPSQIIMPPVRDMGTGLLIKF